MSEGRVPPPGWGAFCQDEVPGFCGPDNHQHVEQATCVAYLRGFPNGQFADIRDDQCCVCYFESDAFDWGEPLEDVEVTIPLRVRVEGSNESGSDDQEHAQA